jgi:ribosomal protein S18 acetylase RimI-like enzyme
LPPTDTRSVTAFSYDDLPDVMSLYGETNAGRSGTTVRSPEYWRSQLEWLQEDRDGFLISRTDDGALAGYLRSRAAPAGVEILELGVGAGDVETGRALLSSAAVRSGGRRASSG